MGKAGKVCTTGKMGKMWIWLPALGIFLFCSFYSGLVVKRYELQSGLLDRSVRLVLIADLHSHIYGNHQRDLIDLIKKQNPDLLLLAGDIADDRVPNLGTELFLEGAAELCPIYYVTGNHESWSPDLEKIKEMFRGYGVRILENEYEEVSVNGNAFVIAGIEDPAKRFYKDKSGFQYDAMRKAFAALPDAEGYKILLAHRPELIEMYGEFPFDLVVSGHAHGGQVRIPFLLNGLFAPNQGFFPKYAGGLYTHGDMTHIVSRGLSINPRLPRVFNPPEVVVIEIGPN